MHSYEKNVSLKLLWVSGKNADFFITKEKCEVFAFKIPALHHAMYSVYLWARALEPDMFNQYTLPKTAFFCRNVYVT